MKLTSVILLSTCLHVVAAGSAQKVSISLKNVPIQKVFREIALQGGVSVIYNDKYFKDVKPVSINVKEAVPGEVIKQCLSGLPFTYSEEESSIVITPTGGSNPGMSDQSYSPAFFAIPIKGYVTDGDGNPLVGATVAVKNSNTSIKTTGDGSFVINANAGDILVITFVGYDVKEIKLNASLIKNGNIGTTELIITPTAMREVVVNKGYYTERQRLSTGSVGRITEEEISKQPVTNILQTMEGRVTGLSVSQTSGLPGTAVNVQIRGQNSLKSDPTKVINPIDNPFFIIDGVPFAPQNVNINQYSSVLSPASGANSVYNNPYGGVSPFSSIDPSEIESIEVLKGADATAIYGSRGANGVILITTKKGKIGKTKVGFSVNTGSNKVSRSIPMMNTQQYLQMRREAIANDGDSLSDPYIYAPDFLNFDTARYTDWFKYFFGGTARSTSVNGNLSGGNNNVQFLIGASYTHQNYMFPGDFAYNRAGLNNNLRYNSNDKRFQLEFSSNFSYDINNTSGAPEPLTAYTLMPNYPALLDERGNLNWTYNGIDLYDNPLQYLKRSYQAKNYNLGSHLQIGYEVIPGLTVRTAFGYSRFGGSETGANPSYSYDPNLYGANRSANASAYFGTNTFETWIIEPQAEYKRKLGFGKLSALLGSTFQQNTNSSTSVSGSGYLNDGLLGTISAASVITGAGDGYALNKYSGVFGRLNYTIADKYILNLTGRRDGSSRFGPDNQFGNFGSVAGAWIFSEERLIKDHFSLISFGKIRISYGTSGNDNIGNYQYYPNWKSTSRAYQGTRGYTPQNLFNPDFSWAVNKQLDLGLDLGFLKDRILINATWFSNRCGNQLISYRLPSQVGFTTVVQNFEAVVQNQGLELQLATTNIKSKNISWTSSFNITLPKNKLLSFPGLETSSYASSYILGKSLNIRRLFKYAGINDTTGLFEFETAHNGRSTFPVAFDDYLSTIDRNPVYGGFRNNFTYKGLTLDLFFQFAIQDGANYLQQLYQTPPGVVGYNLPALLTSHWPSAKNSNIQRLTQNFGSDAAGIGAYYFSTSDGAYSDASYIRLKTLSLSYTIQNKFLKRAKLQGINIYANVQNLFTITQYKLGDPESQSIYGIPPLKTFVTGIQLNF